jgi:hypothetical protein
LQLAQLLRRALVLFRRAFATLATSVRGGASGREARRGALDLPLQLGELVGERLVGVGGLALARLGLVAVAATRVEIAGR